MKQPLLAAALAALLASPLAAADHLLRFDGWRMTNATDYFLEDLRGVLPSDTAGKGLSAARSFTVMATLTCPKTFNDYAGALSLGVPGETQLTLTFPGANADGRAYLSASGDDVLPGTWFVPAEAFSTARDGGRTLALALVWDAPAKTLSLWLDGERQPLSGPSGAQGPALAPGAVLTHLRLSGRMNDPLQGTPKHYFSGGAYADVGVFDAALGEEAIRTGSALAAAALRARDDGSAEVVPVALDGAGRAWDAAWDGKAVVVSGHGTLTLGAEGAAPKALALTAGTALTVRAPLGAAIAVGEAVAAAPSATLALTLTDVPADAPSGAYALVRTPAWLSSPALEAVSLDLGESDAHAAVVALDKAAGLFSLANVRSDAEGFLTLRAPEDYAWYLADCPDGAKIRLGADLVIEGSHTLAAGALEGVSVFDGAGRTLTLALGASFVGEGVNVGLIAAQARAGGTVVKNLRVSVEGTLSGGTSNLGVLVGYTDAARPVAVSNVHVSVSGRLEGQGSVGGLVGGFWSASGSVIADARVDLLEGAVLSGGGEDANRGVGGALGALRTNGSSNGTLRNVLVTAAPGVAFSGATGRGVLVGRFQNTGAVEGCAVVDLGAEGVGLTLSAAGQPAVWQAPDATATAPEGVTPAPLALLEGRVPMGGRASLRPILQGEGLTVARFATDSGVWTLARDAEDAACLTVEAVSEEAAPDAEDTLAYAVAVPAVAPPEGAVFDNLLAASCTLSMLTDDGFALLDSERDYAWYLADCPDGAKVRLGADLVIEGSHTLAEGALEGVAVFDGAGRTLTLAPGASLVGEGKNVGLIAAQGRAGGTVVKDLRVSVEGTLSGGTSNLGALVGYTDADFPVAVSNVCVSVSGRLEGQGSVGGLVGGFWDAADSVIADARVDLLEGAVLSGEDVGRGVGGALGALRAGSGSGQAGTLRGVRVAAAPGVVLRGGANTSGCGLLVGYRGTERGVVKGCAGLDQGAEVSGADFTDASALGAEVWVGAGVPARYAAAEICLDGEALVERGALTLVTGGEVVVAEAAIDGAGWGLTREGNVVTLAAPESADAAGARGTLTYRLEGFAAHPFTLTLVQPSLAGLPSGATAGQAAALRRAAAEAGLAEARFVLPEGADPEALECFTGVVAADAEAGTLTLDCRFGVTEIRREGEALLVTVSVESAAGGADFAAGTAVSLAQVGGEGALAFEEATPEPAPVGVRLFRLRPGAGTCLFRAEARAVAAAE